jgi:2-keto-4-pentenoate hydratase/2-oxohepta-3-ene-1,7-dioic acid hydratase in catechol pathway
MKLVTFEVKSPIGPLRRAGALEADGSTVDLNVAYRSLLESGGSSRAAAVADAVVPSDLLEILRGGTQSLDGARAAFEHVAGRDDVDTEGRTVRHRPGTYRLLAPLPRPNSLRDFLVFEAHLRNARKGAVPPDEWYRMPAYYKANVDAIIGPDDVVAWPRYTDKLDYELEVCAVIGRAGRSLTAEAAGAHIVGYTIYNDWSARDIQRREMTIGLGPGQGKDFASSIGPCILTADEFDPTDAMMRARVDGEQWSEGNLGTMNFSFPEIIEWVSMEQTLQPGDLLGSGTVGFGCGLEIDRWLQPGNVVELEVDGIGVLRNRVGPRPAGELVTAARNHRPAPVEVPL